MATLNDSWQMVAFTNKWLALPPLSPVRLMVHDAVCLITATSAVIMMAYLSVTEDQQTTAEGPHSTTGFMQVVKVPAFGEEQPQRLPWKEHDLIGNGCWFLFAVM